jgi:hypothetical protein
MPAAARTSRVGSKLLRRPGRELWGGTYSYITRNLIGLIIPHHIRPVNLINAPFPRSYQQLACSFARRLDLLARSVASIYLLASGYLEHSRSAPITIDSLRSLPISLPFLSTRTDYRYKLTKEWRARKHFSEISSL